MVMVNCLHSWSLNAPSASDAVWGERDKVPNSISAVTRTGQRKHLTPFDTAATLIHKSPIVFCNVGSAMKLTCICTCCAYTGQTGFISTIDMLLNQRAPRLRQFLPVLILQQTTT